MTQATNSELTIRKQLDNVFTLDQALAFFAENGIDVNDNEADGIKALRVVDKDELLGKPFLILSWRFNEGDFGDFVSAEIALADGQMLVLNDGSTGIAQQLSDLTEHRIRTNHKSPDAGRMVQGGLSKTNYWFNETTGETSSKKPEGSGKEWKPASTYYLQYA